MSEYSEVRLTQRDEWGRGSTQSIDFIVTEDCNLRCKYCYICHKKSGRVMSFSVAKKFIDYIFSDEFKREDGVILGFIGGEPFLETELIDKIVDYFKMKSLLSDSSWWWNYRISITTNGINYASNKVQNFIAKNKNKLSITITIDGTKEKHDLHRVFPDGSGSYDIIKKNIPMYLNQFPGTTKVTFASEDLHLLKDSIIHLWDSGIYDVSANVVFENVWKDGDDIVFEEQLKQLADYMIDNNSYTKKFVSFFDDYIGKPLTEEQLTHTSCGAGRMLAVGPSGNIYPCLRYKDYSLGSSKREVVVGNVDSGINFDKVLRFRVSTYPMQCDDECLKCEIAVGCMFCQGQSYDEADTETNFQRSKSICKMHKARVRANNYYFNRLYNEKGISRTDSLNEYKKMYFIASDNFVNFCECDNLSVKDNDSMPKEVFLKGLEYCAKNFFYPIILHSYEKIDMSLFEYPSMYKVTHIISAKFYDTTKGAKDCLYVFDRDTYQIDTEPLEVCILNIYWSDIENLFVYTKKLFDKVERINLNILGAEANDNLNVYKRELSIIQQYIFNSWVTEGIKKEFSKLTDVLFSNKQEACRCGDTSFALGVEGKFYICPHNYRKSSEAIGSLYGDDIHIKNAKLYNYDYAVLCRQCPAKHCVRCMQVNIDGTGEVNIPPMKKCTLSLLEYEQSVCLFKNIKAVYPDFEMRHISSFEYSTPFEMYVKNKGLY